MRIKQSCIVIALLVSGTAAYADPLDVKPGLWEVTTTTGMPPVDTSRMTPEQKARFEAAMRAREAQGPRAKVRKSCMTKEKLEREPFGEKDQEHCTHTVISNTRTHWESKMRCTRPERVGTFSIEAVSRERIKGAVQINASDEKNKMVVHVTFEGKWLGSNCGDTR